jgi:YHS domain-containing protein
MGLEDMGEEMKEGAQNEENKEEENKEGEENKENGEEKKEEEKKEEENKEEDKKEEEKKEEEVKEGEVKEGEAKEGEQKEGEAKEGEQNEEEQKEGEQKEVDNGEEGKEGQRGSERMSNIGQSISALNNAQSQKLEEYKNIPKESNYILFHFLSKDEEIKQFISNQDDYQDYIIKIKDDIKAPKILSFEKIAEILYKDEEEDLEQKEEESENPDSKEEESELKNKIEEGKAKFSLNIKYEYQDCCPVDIIEEGLKKIGKVLYTIKYNGKYYKFSSMENMMKFKENPNKYINLVLPVRKVNKEQNILSEKQIMFNNTVNFLEFTFGSLITKGMLELSNNRIKYPYLNVKESSLKYLALFLKANNPKNNKYAKEKYKKILKDFIRNSELPWELYHVYENYKKEKDNLLNKKLIRKQLDTVSIKYDKLMEKAKIQNNTRFANFFRIDNETGEEDKNE